jgi:hypothetical protein
MRRLLQFILFLLASSALANVPQASVYAQQQHDDLVNRLDSGSSLTWAQEWKTDPTGMFEKTLKTAAEWSVMAVPIPGLGFAAAGERALFRGAGEFAAEEGTRALRLPMTDASLTGTRTLGYTTPRGDVFLQSGLSRAEQMSTLQHESVHAFFSPAGDGPLATFRQSLGQWGYDNSQLLRFSEEAMAETYSSGSLLQGLRHPLVNGYGITSGGVLLEGGVVGGGLFGAGYLGYRIGGGGH